MTLKEKCTIRMKGKKFYSTLYQRLSRNYRVKAKLYNYL